MQLNLKYRPTKFSELVGNETAIRKLLEKYPDWPSTFLFTGDPGIGKTTLARCIAEQLDVKSSNYHEIDAGQDRGIDNIRRIINSASARPLAGKNKIYIFDECQGLTKEAQQALLKITEEPPANTYFVFCSTDPQKIIKALKERCRNGYINLQPFTKRELGLIIKKICESENIDLDDRLKDIATLCINNSDGIPRKAIMYLNKFYNYDSVEQVAKEIEDSDIYIEEEFWKYPNALDKDPLSFISLFKEKEDKNFESFRIIMSNIFKKRLLNALCKNEQEKIKKYSNILEIFSDPVDQHIGDAEIIRRFAKYYLNHVNCTSK